MLEQPAPVLQDLMAQLLRLAVPAPLADDPGQPVPGRQGIWMIVTQDPARS